MSKYNSICIKDAMNNIASNNYLLPAIQRKFVWDCEQIEILFDSIMRNYPINSLMLWKITDKKVKQEYTFYQFLQDFAQKFHEENIKAPAQLLNNDFFAVIDGQQRLTSLYIGLIGSYRAKRPNKRWRDNEDALPTRHLYLELSSALESAIDNEKMYNFAFLTKDELNAEKQKTPEHFWFKVGDVLQFNELSDVTAYIVENGLISNKFAMSTLSNLFNKINTEELLNYYVIAEQDQDKVLDIFIRTNSGGTPLSFSDLLMSIASANWTAFDAREEMKKIRDEIYAFGNPNFDVSQDFILKSILVLSDVDVRFKIENFGRNNVALFENKWNDIRASLVATFSLLEQLGFNDSLLRAKNAAIPIAYYIYKNNLASSIVKTTYNKQDRKSIAKWLSMSLLKGMFGGQSDGILKSLRDIIKGSNSATFPIDEIVDAFKSNIDKNYTFNDDVIASLLEEEYGSTACGLTLMLLYPDVVLQHGKAVAEDHLHPKTVFETKQKLQALNLTSSQEEFYTDRKNYNSVANLQLLEESKNKSKSDLPLDMWVTNNAIQPADLYIDAGISLDILEFEKFIENRKENLTKKLKTVLGL